MLAAVRSDGLLAQGRPVLVMVSGGRDSTCLADLAVAVAGAAHVRALHVNYRLRTESDADEEHCRALCEALGIALHVRHPARAQGGNLQAWARAVRYDAARELAGSGCDIAAGHTATDQVETILYRLASSPSRRALLGMAPRDRQLIRPLLGFTREQTADYCRQRGLSWREDDSNVSRAYARARVREDLVPALRAIHPGAEANVLALAAILRDEAAVLDELVAGILDGRAAVARARLRELPSALARLVVQRLADQAAGGPAAGVGRRTAELLALPEPGELHVGAALRAVCAGGELRFEPLR